MLMPSQIEPMICARFSVEGMFAMTPASRRGETLMFLKLTSSEVPVQLDRDARTWCRGEPRRLLGETHDLGVVEASLGADRAGEGQHGEGRVALGGGNGEHTK